MPKKFKIEDHIPTYEETEVCERCGKEGAADFNTESLCVDCVATDVFESFNDEND